MTYTEHQAWRRCVGHALAQAQADLRADPGIIFEELGHYGMPYEFAEAKALLVHILRTLDPSEIRLLRPKEDSEDL